MLESALAEERRTNRRLRALLDVLSAQVTEHRRQLALQFNRMTQMQAELDSLTPRLRT